jgi:hypothetical protein
MGAPQVAQEPLTGGPSTLFNFQRFSNPNPNPKPMPKFKTTLFPASKNHEKILDGRRDQGEHLSFWIKIQNHNRF